MSTSREIYTHGHPEAALRSHRWRTIENSAAYLLPKLRPGVTVLDVGCGPGTITADLARRVHPGEVLGIDSAADVVARAAHDHRGSNLSFRTGDVYHLDQPDGRFDVAHTHQLLQHLAEPVAALVEMRRVCRRGGSIAAREADYGAMAWWPQSAGLQQWLDIYTTVARANGGQPDAGRHLVAWLHAAGLPDLTASASAWCFAAPDERTWWAHTWAQRTINSPLADRAIQLGVATPNELSECADAWRTWAKHPDALFLVPHTEVLAPT